MKLKLLAVGTALFAVGGISLLFSHWKATRHELYQVWDSIDELRGQKNGN